MPASLLTVTPLTASGISHVFDNFPNTGVILWLDATKIAGITSGTSLSAWTDSSASLSHATQPSATSQPVFKTNVQNGLSAVSFNGVGEYMASPTSVLATGTIAFTGMTTSTGAQGIIASTNNLGQQMLFNVVGTKYAFNNNTRVDGSAVTASAWITGIAIQSGSTATLSISGTTFVGVIGGSDTTFVNLGILTKPSGQSFSGLLGEIIVYNRQLSETERVSLETYLRTKWGTL